MLFSVSREAPDGGGRTPLLRAPSAPLAAQLRVRGFEAKDRPAWNEFVNRHSEGTFCHLAEWQDVLQRAFGHATYYLIAERGGMIFGVLPLAHIKSAIFSNALVSTPFCVYGGVLADDAVAGDALIEKACALARRLRVDYLELRNLRRSQPTWPSKDLYVTFRKPIKTASEDNMLAIPRKQRAMVRKGIQKELRVEIDSGVERLYSIYSESLRNLGTPIFSQRYLRVLREVFGESAEVLTISHQGRAIASVLSFYFKGDVLPYYGGGTTEARALAGNDFMYWSVMERARDRGVRTFDYGRSKRGTGAFDFKVNWGFEPQPLFYEYFLVRAKTMPNLSPTNPKFDRLIRIWRRLPLPLTQWLGPPLAKYLG